MAKKLTKAERLARELQKQQELALSRYYKAIARDLQKMRKGKGGE